MKPHLFLNNPRGEKKLFNVGRKIESDDEIIPEKPAQAYRPQKDRLNSNFGNFVADRRERVQNRNIDVPVHIEYPTL